MKITHADDREIVINGIIPFNEDSTDPLITICNAVKNRIQEQNDRVIAFTIQRETSSDDLANTAIRFWFSYLSSDDNFKPSADEALFWRNMMSSECAQQIEAYLTDHNL